MHKHNCVYKEYDLCYNEQEAEGYYERYTN